MIIKNLKLTQRDLAEFYTFVQKDKSSDSAAMKRKNLYFEIGSMLILFLIVFKFFQDPDFSFDFKTAFLISAIFISFIFLYFVNFLVTNSRIRPSKDAIIYRSHNIEINDTEIISTSEIYQNRFSIKNVVKIVKTKNLLLIFYDKTMATIIPLTEFKNNDELQCLIDFIEKHRGIAND